MARRKPQGEMDGFALVAGGFFLVGMSVVGYVLGGLIGKLFDARLIGAVIGLLIGTVIGFWDFYRIAMLLMRRQSIPTATEQQAAKENWEKFEKSENDEGVRD